MKRTFFGWWIFLLLAGLAVPARCGEGTTEPVLVGRGMEIRGVLLPGPELRVRRSRGLAEPLVLRIAAVYPHGTAGFRYDFQGVPMVAGTHDLAQWLETADGQPAKGLPPLVFEAIGILPSGPPGPLPEPPPAAPPKAGWYQILIPFGLTLWAAIGGWGFWFFRRRKIIAELAASPPEPTLRERVKKIVEHAIAQPLGTPEKAELERLLLAHGREQLGLAEAADPAVWQALRDSPKTASSLRLLENWLHRPATAAPSGDELRELLTRLQG